MSDNIIKDFELELINRNYSKRTIDIYVNKLRKYLQYRQERKSENNIPDFIGSIESRESKRHAYTSIKLLYKYVFKRECPYTLKNVKKRKRLPITLTKEEILKIISTNKNNKYKLMLSIMYGSGLRVSEVVNIKVSDIDLSNMTLFIRNSKGQKDRYTIISNKIIGLLIHFKENKKPDEFLFLTQYQTKYSIRTVQKIFKDSLLKSGIQKKASCHTLRHSFATHLLNNGIDIRRIKSLLGHKSIRTTMVYLHLSDLVNQKIKSPL